MSNDTRFDVIVIGSGPAGQNAAIQAAQAGCSVCIIERERGVGGACVYQGTIPSKTLRESALQLTRVPDPFSVEIDESMQVSTLMTRLDAVISTHGEHVAQQLERNGVTRIHGRARFVSPTEIEVQHVDGLRSLYEGKTIVIASGSRPRLPQNVPVDHEHILDSDSILSMIYLPRTLTVLGGGVIASEYASIFAILGVQVTMVDRYERPLGFLDPELTERFLQTFEGNGGRFLGQRQVRSVKWDGVSRVLAQLDDGSEVHSEKMLVAQGRVANLDWLEIANAGLSATPRGLLSVNEYCRTAVDNIYAVGDVIGPPSLASSAMEQGRRAISHAMGSNPGHTPEQIPAGIYAIPEMSTVGLTEIQARERFGDVTIGRAAFGDVARGMISGSVDGMLKLIADADGQRLLGVAIVGDGATELIHIGQMGLISNCVVDTFVEHIFNFPTLAEAYRIAALDIVQQREHRSSAETVPAETVSAV